MIFVSLLIKWLNTCNHLHANSSTKDYINRNMNCKLTCNKMYQTWLSWHSSLLDTAFRPSSSIVIEAFFCRHSNMISIATKSIIDSTETKNTRSK